MQSPVVGGVERVGEASLHLFQEFSKFLTCYLGGEITLFSVCLLQPLPKACPSALAGGGMLLPSIPLFSWGVWLTWHIPAVLGSAGVGEIAHQKPMYIG